MFLQAEKSNAIKNEKIKIESFFFICCDLVLRFFGVIFYKYINYSTSAIMILMFISSF